MPFRVRCNLATEGKMKTYQPEKSTVLVAICYLCNFVAYGYVKIRGHCSRLREISTSTSCTKLSHADCVSQYFLFRYASGRSLILMKPLFLDTIFKVIIFV